MSVIFGIHDSSDPRGFRQALELLAPVTIRYGPDGTTISANGSVGMCFQAFQTHQRSLLERQPYLDGLGNMVALDGRLDNYEDIAAALGVKAAESPDSVLILGAFERWGQECFSRLVGEWAVALWNSQDRVLYLARDHAGTRTLFYRNVGGRTIWSTYLETFFTEKNPLELSKEYLARTIACQPAGESTPYRDIHAVRPGHYMAIKDGKASIRPHWNCIAESEICYRREAEYDEHYLQLFGQAISRRSPPGTRAIAELSGGMDSSAIVCMRDHMACGPINDMDTLDTVSYYDDTEPDWDDRIYFEAIERYRQKIGIHIDVSQRIAQYEPLLLQTRIYPYICGDRSYFDAATKFENAVGGKGHRVILSGIGGDELLGGVPTPLPELTDYVRRGQLSKLISRAFAWSLVGRRPFGQLILSSIEATIALCRGSVSEVAPSWLTPEGRRLCSHSNPRRVEKRTLICARPSAIANGHTWWVLLDTLPNQAPKLLGCYEYRFPFLDRDLVEFLHRLPRQQLVQPGRRRLLMRRALRGIIPTEVLERRRKAFVSRGLTAHLQKGRPTIEKLFADSLLAEYGLVDSRKIQAALQAALSGEMAWIGHLTRAIDIEIWLRGLRT
ncbi:asparagine synthase-related protein [Granulicella sp. L60]|uniref:asparagine synthase-related protein n=1 Tax=Granulicella sp. L60 TaxID=1641866 RepID=UPI00131D76A9|nr:asparagine synthase-related protein [Granulicella sp. L60]